MAVTKLFGASIKRREDPRLMTGRANFTDDVRLPGMTSMAVLRSPHAHAKIVSIDTSAAKAMPGVVAVYTGADLIDDLAPVPCAWLVPNANLVIPEYRAVATDRVRFVGDAVAVVVAEDRYLAQDAADKIEVEYDVLPAVVDQEAATQDGAPQLYDNVPNNIAFHWELGGGDIDAAFADADVTISKRIVNQRLIPNPMETRGAVAAYNPGSGELTLWVTTQNPHVHRLLIALTTSTPESQVRIIAGDVGGGFGCKIPTYAGEMIACAIAKRLGRPVRWQEDRRENFVTTTHGRDHITQLEVAAKNDGTVTGIRVKTYASMGAHLSTAGPGVPTWLYALMLPGPYTIKNFHADVYGVLTNNTATDAYRGAGRPEATYLLERAMDLVARELKMDPVAVRSKNLVPAGEFPYTSAAGLLYDSGNYQGALAKALEVIDYAGFRAEQAKAREEGRLLGIGFSTYVEVCGLAPSAAAGAMGFQGGLWESAIVRFHPTGKVTVFTGTNSHGQGHKTTFAQVVADELGVPFEDVDIVHGDTQMVPMGMGTYGSRSLAVGGAAIVSASRMVVEKARTIAAHLMEVGVDDVTFDSGTFYVTGAPDKVKTIQEVALASYLAWNMPEGVTPGLEATYFYDPSNNVYPFGTHVCVVEVDKDTGQVAFKRYVAIDDVGYVVNPMIVDGQVHGGITQGLAQAVYESAVYDEAGQLLTGSLMDYAIPKAAMLPWFEVDRTETPSPTNVMGIKGAGETGTIASTPAVANAILDALAPYGVDHIDMPLTPQKIWRLIHEQKG
ncbi:MAG: carbon monoxide dehydrogenase [Chloroflexi bacterium]|nr:MAG: carbon monoxide dehydrogenase [Chloroflexota bacterium]